MLRKTLSLVVAALLAMPCGVCGTAVAADEATDEKPTLHYYTGAPVEKIPDELLEADSHGGELIPLEKYNFSSKDAQFDNEGIGLVWTELDGQGFCRLTIEDEAANKYLKSEAFDLKVNRQYLLSILIWSDFSRFYETTNRTREICMSLSVTNAEATKEFISLRRGMPDYTEGWKRLEVVFSPGLLEAGSKGRLNFSTAAFTNGAPESAIYIADFRVFELPEKELVPYKEGEGMVFRGSAGDLDMRVEDAVQTENKIVVNTTGARYTFDTENDTITADQKIGTERTVSEWRSGVSLAGLTVRSKTDTEAVLTNPEISFGVQMDGTVFLTPHKGDVRMECTSKIGGIWNRFNFGYLMALDDYGGFTVTPDIPAGTGKRCSYEILTDGLDFPTWQFNNAVAWNGDEPAAEFNTKISNAKPGWQIAWTVSPGERLAITTFPPREYDWEESFNNNYRNVYPAASHYTRMPEYAEEQRIGTVVTWSFDHNTSGMEYGRYYLFDKHEDELKDMVKTAHDNGVQALPYTSGYFYYNSDEPTEYINEIKRLRDTYGFDGVYSDGLPSESRWVVGYEEARMLRELFPSGTIIVHQTGQPANGGPPLSSPAYFLPMVDAYLSITLKGENVGLMGKESPLAHMTWNQYNIANCIGVQKGDYWKYDNDEGETVMIPQISQDLMHLIQNGRARNTNDDNWMNIYLPMLNRLEQEWKEHGSEDNFYEKYFAPLARTLSRDYLSYLGDFNIIDQSFDGENPLADYSVTNADVSLDTENGNTALIVNGKRNRDTGSLFKKTMSLSGKIAVEYDFTAREAADYEAYISDDYGTHGVGVQFSSDGKIKLRGSNGGYTVIGRYKRGAVQKVKLEINTDTHRLNVYVGENKLISNFALSEELYYISDYEFFTGGYGSSFKLDNFKVTFNY